MENKAIFDSNNKINRLQRGGEGGILAQFAHTSYFLIRGSDPVSLDMNV